MRNSCETNECTVDWWKEETGWGRGQESFCEGQTIDRTSTRTNKKNKPKYRGPETWRGEREIH